MKLLALETATEACSAALLTDQGVIDRFEHAPRMHTRLILPMIESLLKEAGIELTTIDAIAFGRGPGAFTGLRIAAGIAQGLALSVDVPVVPVSTLAALARQAQSEAPENSRALPVIATLDARMGEIYWGKFNLSADSNSDRVVPDGVEQVAKPENFSNRLLQDSTLSDGFIAIGSGWDAYAAELDQILSSAHTCHIRDILPAAKYVAQLARIGYQNGEAVAPEQAQPVYIRDKVAEKQKHR